MVLSAAADLANIPLGQRSQILALEHHLAGRMARRRIVQQLLIDSASRTFPIPTPNQRQRRALLDIAELERSTAQRRASTALNASTVWTGKSRSRCVISHAITGRSLRGSKGVAHRLADEYHQRLAYLNREKAAQANPRGLDVCLALRQQLLPSDGEQAAGRIRVSR